MKEHMQDINPTVLIIYSINPPVRDITCPLTVGSAPQSIHSFALEKAKNYYYNIIKEIIKNKPTN
jgi:hypothetical protein